MKENIEETTKQRALLIVDDHEENAKMVELYLKRKNIKAIISNNGASAIELARSAKPDLILLDIMMPEMDGIETAKAIQAQIESADIPIIFLTAKSSSEDVIKGLQLGAVDYISKPFNAMELIARVETHLKMKDYKDQIIEKNKQLEKLSVERNEFLGIAAHDLKNPIYNISMLAKVIKEEDLNKAEIDEFADDILKTSERMLELIKNLLDFNAIEQGKININLEKTDICELALAVADNYKERAAIKGISIIADNSGALPVFANADRSAFIQILDNLISNAVKYSPFDKKIFLNIGASDQICYVSVKDEGPGLSDEDQKKLFGKFARLTPQPTGDEHSNGLGLSIVKKYAQLMNGDIRVETKLGEGCDFILELPQFIDN
jgi:signal transduction histidine kinase